MRIPTEAKSGKKIEVLNKIVMIVCQDKRTSFAIAEHASINDLQEKLFFEEVL